jgi:tyrosinase
MAGAFTIRLEVGSANVTALRDAYRAMQETSPSDNRSWVYWADLHGFPSFDCWHHFREGPANKRYKYNLFLPWHRAYLLSWEHIARDRDAAAVPPFWDWSSRESHRDGIPAAFSDPQVDGQPNPLASGPAPDMPDLPAHSTRRFPGDPADLPSADEVEHVLAGPTTFEDFSAQVEDLHDRIHGWVGGINPDDQSSGGDMGVVATAAFDPIFWAHHAMIDRLWYLWQLRHGTTNIPPQYRGLPLAPFGLTVDDVLDIHNLGYDYALSAAAAAGPTASGGTT